VRAPLLGPPAWRGLAVGLAVSPILRLGRPSIRLFLLPWPPPTPRMKGGCSTSAPSGADPAPHRPCWNTFAGWRTDNPTGPRGAPALWVRGRWAAEACPADLFALAYLMALPHGMTSPEKKKRVHSHEKANFRHPSPTLLTISGPRPVPALASVRQH